ncbi:MAG TPA: hypothetical protein VGS79_24940 [Puia sp.]|nr:hypothetical protein [Puia sp.]
MEERTDSWHHLQDHSTPPPREVLEKLRELLDPSAAAGETDTAFRKLASHSIPPPEQLRTAIINLTNPATGRRLTRWLPYASAAACILFFAVGFGFYKRVHDQKAGIVQNSAHPMAIVTPTDTSSRSLPATASATPAAIDSTGTTAIQLSPAALTVDGDRFSLSDNNPLVTFTSYRYPDLGKRINSPKNETVLHIHLDQYTNIALSPAMTATLRDLYDTRPDGTPSRKARRTRERLLKWDAEDAKEFDPHTTANPLDAVDLAEFLFPPLFSFGHHSGGVLPAAASDASAPEHTSTPEYTSAPAHASTPADSAFGRSTDNSPLTISYTLTLITKRTNNGIGETYNGGIQTLFMQNGYDRLRLASLIRIQSMFMTPGTHSVTLLTESAKPRQEVVLTPGQWSAYNDKYAGMTRALINDSIVILGHHCKKALITLRDGRRITAWYTPDILQPAQASVEPAFTGIPGLVLRYEFICRRKTVRYTATELSRRPIDPSVFAIPPAP